MPDQDGGSPPPWSRVVRRSVGSGALAAALGVLWYFLSEPEAGVYGLALAALGVGIVLRADGASWTDDRKAFLREHGVEVTSCVVLAAVSGWLLLGRPAPAVVGPAMAAAFVVLVIAQVVKGGVEAASDEEEPGESPTGPQWAVAFVLFWTAFVAVVLLATWIGPWPLPFSG